ncbi:MAG: ABC transporter permease [Gemmatimonadaceae bacterium]
MSDQHKERIVPPSAKSRVAQELDFHIDMAVRDLIAQGVEPGEARRRAVAALGDLSQLSAECQRLDRETQRMEWRTRFLAEFSQDVRFAWRMLRRRRAFATLAIVTLALGIGAATSIYSVVDGVLLRPLPFSEPERLASVWIRQPELAKNPAIASFADATPLGNEEYQALRAESKTLHDVALWQSGEAIVSSNGGMERIATAVVTSSIFNTLRLRMTLGRSFTPGEDVLNGAPIALVSWESWQSRYGGDSAVIGRTVRLNDEEYSIVGVLPRGVRLDRSRDIPVYWLPALRDSFDLVERHNRGYVALGRLAPSATFEGASLEAGRIIRAATKDSTAGARVEQWQSDETRESRGALFVLLGAVSLLLIIACVNVATLLLGEAATRSREMAARAALGAGSTRLVRQLLTESLVIAMVSTVAGSALAWGLTRGLVAVAPTRLPGIDEVAIDGRVLLFAVAIATLTGLAFGLLPALTAGRADAASLVRVGMGMSERRAKVVQRSLVALQLSLSLVLLTEGALLAQSLRNLAAVNPGFESEGVMVARIALPNRYDEDEGLRRSFLERMGTRLRSIPGVVRVAATSNPPFASGASSSPLLIEGDPSKDEVGNHTQQRYVEPGYFETMGMRLIAGRWFNADDRRDGEPVAIVSESEVRRDFKGRDPLQTKVQHQRVWRRVVGVVADAKYSGLAKPDAPTVYVPVDQYPWASDYVLRLRAGTPTLSLATVREAVREVESAAVVTRVEGLPRLVATSYGPERYRTILVAAFAFLAAILAAIGMYGVSTRAATARRREAGVRIALGSSEWGITRLLVGDAMRGVVAGVALAIPAVLLVGRVVQPYLFGISERDPRSFLVVAVFLAGVTGVASFVPSWRASRSEPVSVLRSD